MKICSTGFSRIDLLHLLKLVDLIGEPLELYRLKWILTV
jgi:hypothetical protein